MKAEISKKVFGLIDSEVNQKRISELEAQGVRVLKFPSLKIERVADQTVIKKAVRNLPDFDWIIFSDIHTVKFFIEGMDENGIDPFELDDVTVCAFGEAVADRLRFSQVHADVIPAILGDDAIIATVQNYVSEFDELKAMKVMFLSEAGSSYEFVPRLRSEVKKLADIGIYRVDGVSENERTKLTTLLKGGAIDEFVFCSVDDVENLVRLLHPVMLQTHLSGVKISAFDPVAFQALRENNLKPRLMNG